MKLFSYIIIIIILTKLSMPYTVNVVDFFSVYKPFSKRILFSVGNQILSSTPRIRNSASPEGRDRTTRRTYWPSIARVGVGIRTYVA